MPKHEDIYASGHKDIWSVTLSFAGYNLLHQLGIVGDEEHSMGWRNPNTLKIDIDEILDPSSGINIVKTETDLLIAIKRQCDMAQLIGCDFILFLKEY